MKKLFLLSVAFLCAIVCIAAGKTTIIMKKGQVIDLGGNTVEVSKFIGSGEVRNGIIVSDSFIVNGSLLIPAYTGMELCLEARLLDNPATLTLVGSATNVVINASNLRDWLTIRYPTNTISGVTLVPPTYKKMQVRADPDGWTLTRDYPFRLSLK